MSLTNLWQSRSISFKSRNGEYPLWSLLYNYVVTFVFDASILLVWPILLYKFTFDWDGFQGIGNLFEFMSIGVALKTIISGALAMYASVILIRLAKETLKFVLENLVSWILNVIHSIGQMLVNIWKFNIVIRRKEG